MQLNPVRRNTRLAVVEEGRPHLERVGELLRVWRVSFGLLTNVADVFRLGAASCRVRFASDDGIDCAAGT